MISLINTSPSTTLFSKISSILTSKNESAVCFLLYWRLFLLSITISGIACWHFFYNEHHYWTLTLITLFCASTWTAFVLKIDWLQTREHSVSRELCFDLAWIFAIALLTGRSANPFIYYFLVVVALSATLVDKAKAWLVSITSIVIYSILLYLDMQEHFEHFSSDYKIHLIGMWLNYLISTVVICFFVSQLMNQLRQKETSIRAFRERTLKNEQLIALATVAASAVHNLATPLSTLRLLVNEQAEEPQNKEQLKDDLELMSKQITRCHHTIDELSLLAQKSDELNPVTIHLLVSEFIEHYSLHFPEANVIITNTVNTDTQISCTPLFKYAIVNLINNAIESSSGDIKISFDEKTDTDSHLSRELCINIKNRCTESVDLITQRWGKPIDSQKNNGLGIGSMLANSTIEQQGGRVIFDANSLENQNETLITVTIIFPIEKT